MASRIGLDSFSCVLLVQHHKMWDGRCLDEMWGDEEISFVFLDGQGITTRSLYL